MAQSSPQLGMFEFQIQGIDYGARAGIFRTPHGLIETPVFMPVGTQATVKSLTPAQLEEIGVQILLSNTYHLYLRPGADVIQSLGGLHHFMSWEKPILTDSGGYQVFSLGALRRISDDSVTFKSHINGSMHEFSPESAIRIQESLGADIIMAFDECPAPDDREYNKSAMDRTHQWLTKCAQVKNRSDQALFGIVQGGIFQDLRAKSAEFVSSFDLPGYAIGGLSVGESKSNMFSIIETVNQILPAEKPRYLMGVGTVPDLIEGIKRGVDMFDCVLPTRLARHHTALTRAGRINLSNAAHTLNTAPIEETCSCYTCQNFSRAYLRHLIIAKEMLSATLISIHNITTLVQLTKELRKSILDHTFEVASKEWLQPITHRQKG